jgi:hypothetical protein
MSVDSLSLIHTQDCQAESALFETCLTFEFSLASFTIFRVYVMKGEL